MSKTANPSPFERFDALTRSAMSVPKTELDRRADEDKKRRDARRLHKKH